MPTITFRSPVTKPLLRKGTPKPMPPDPRAYDTFRVTQQFSDVDFYHQDGRLHRATDIGNFRCGDPVVAMARGVAYRTTDGAGALGVRIDHGSNVVTEYWHLDRQDVTNGHPVNPGQQIGIVGDTGLGNVCHLHVEAKRSGVRIDPEPLMFGGFLVIPEIDEDMRTKGKFLSYIHNRKGALTTDAHFRAGVEVGDNDSMAVFKAGSVLQPVIAVEGVSVGASPDAAVWLGCFAYVSPDNAQYRRLGYIHSSVWPRANGQLALEPIEESGGYTAGDLEAAKAAGEKIGRVDEHTKHVAIDEQHLAASKGHK